MTLKFILNKLVDRAIFENWESWQLKIVQCDIFLSDIIG